MKAGLFKPLKNPAYRSLFGAQVFSDLGNWLDFIALQVIIAYHWQYGEGAIASLITIMALPWVFIGPFASTIYRPAAEKEGHVNLFTFAAGICDWFNFFSKSPYSFIVFFA